MRKVLIVVASALLGSCSQYTELSARFVDGRLAFVAMDGRSVDCVHHLSVVDVATRATMWETGGVGRGECHAALPIFYGQATTRDGAMRPLVPGRRYEVSGAAEGGNSMSGRFVVSRAIAWRVEDKRWDAALDESGNITDNVVDTAN